MMTLPENGFRNQIVGFTDKSVYVCTKRMSKVGYYEMLCEPVPWDQVQGIQYRRSLSFGSIALGLAIIAGSIYTFFLGWVEKIFTGPAVFLVPVLGPIAGMILIWGAKRLQLSASSGGRKLRWMAPPTFQDDAELLEILQRIPNLRTFHDDQETDCMIHIPSAGCVGSGFPSESIGGAG